MAIPASNISEVITELDIIIEKCLNQNDKLGLFASLYRKVTLRVQEGIQSGMFDDAARMERLDVIFANRYLEAYQEYNSQLPTTSSWYITFQASKEPNMLLMQHLLAGMNAHISLDLGIASAQVASGKPLAELKRDFDTINQLLSNLVDDVQSAMGQSLIMMKALDWIAGKTDEKLARFSLEFFRNRAWLITTILYNLDEPIRSQSIMALDKQTTMENYWFTNFKIKRLPVFINF